MTRIFENTSDIYKLRTWIEHAGSTVKESTLYKIQQLTTQQQDTRPRHPVLGTLHCFIAGISLSHDELTTRSFDAGTRRRHNGTKKVTVSLPVRNSATMKLTHNDSSPELDTDETNPPVNTSHTRYDQRRQPPSSLMQRTLNPPPTLKLKFVHLISRPKLDATKHLLDSLHMVCDRML
jgi:hypothetical protein